MKTSFYRLNKNYYLEVGLDGEKRQNTRFYKR